MANGSIKARVQCTIEVPVETWGGGQTDRDAPVSLAEAIDRACAGIRVFGDRLALVSRQVTGSLLSGLRLFVDAHLDIAAKAYLRTHRRLPGSERTARLRKKRRVVLLRWFLEYVQGSRDDASGQADSVPVLYSGR